MGGKGSGRRRKPIERHVIDGTFNVTRHGPLDPRGRMALPALDPAPPAQLDVYARAVWERVFPIVVKSGAVTEGDRDVFVLFCDAAGTFNRACDELNRGGWFRAKKKAGSAFDEDSEEFTNCPSPWYYIKRNAAADMTRCASLLGLTPVDRGRVAKAATRNDPAELPATRPKSPLDGAGPIVLNIAHDGGAS